MSKSILFLAETDINGAAARYRVYQYRPYLEKEGIKYKILPSLPNKYFSPTKRFPRLAKINRNITKVIGVSALVLCGPKGSLTFLLL